MWAKRLCTIPVRPLILTRLSKKGAQDGVESFVSSETEPRKNCDTSGVTILTQLNKMKAKLRAWKAPKAPPHQANYNEFSAKVKRMSKRAQYSADATQLMKSGQMGAGKAARFKNQKYDLTSKSKSTVLNYCNKGLAGQSPLNPGPQRKLPPEFN